MKNINLWVLCIDLPVEVLYIRALGVIIFSIKTVQPVIKGVVDISDLRKYIT